MLVSDVLADTVNDIRQVLNATTDAGILIPWVNRIQLDALHTGLYNSLIQGVATIAVVQGTSSYTVSTTPNAIRRILMVYDRTFDRVLLPIDNIMYPTAKSDATPGQQPLQIPEPLLSAKTMQQFPEYYRREGTNTLIIFPAPQKTAFAGTYEIHYEMQAPALTATTDTLLLPNDAKDMVVAGVNMLAVSYLKLDQDVPYWTQQYEMLKKGSFVQ